MRKLNKHFTPLLRIQRERAARKRRMAAILQEYEEGLHPAHIAVRYGCSEQLVRKYVRVNNKQKQLARHPDLCIELCKAYREGRPWTREALTAFIKQHEISRTTLFRILREYHVIPNDV